MHAWDALFANADIRVKVRVLDMAESNKKYITQEMCQTASHILFLVMYCTMHQTHAITTSTISAMLTLRLFNSIYSANVLLHVGGNYYSLFKAIPHYVNTFVAIDPLKRSDSPVAETRLLLALLMGLVHVDGRIYHRAPCRQTMDECPQQNLVAVCPRGA